MAVQERAITDAGKKLATKSARRAGITTPPHKSSDDDPIVGLRGEGGPTTSISFLADTRRHTVFTTSGCAVGDAVEMQSNGE